MSAFLRGYILSILARSWCCTHRIPTRFGINYSTLAPGRKPRSVTSQWKTQVVAQILVR